MSPSRMTFWDSAAAEAGSKESGSVDEEESPTLSCCSEARTGVNEWQVSAGEWGADEVRSTDTNPAGRR